MLNRSTLPTTPDEDAIRREPGLDAPSPLERRALSGIAPAPPQPFGNTPHETSGDSVLAAVEDELLTAADILRGLIIRTRMPWLLRHHHRRVVLAIFSVLMGAISLATIAAVALLTRSPFVFPSLGPAAYLFFYRPGSAAAAPRNAFTRCAIGILAGYFALFVTGLAGAPAATLEGVTWPRVFAVALASALTTALLILFDVTYPPALATTLVVALGAFVQPLSLLTLYGGVVLLTGEALVFNRAAGLPYPLWKARPIMFQRTLGEGLARSAYKGAPTPPEGPRDDA